MLVAWVSAEASRRFDNRAQQASPLCPRLASPITAISRAGSLRVGMGDLSRQDSPFSGQQRTDFECLGEPGAFRSLLPSSSWGAPYLC